MKLYLENVENIYFVQTKEYFREIVSSYDNGNYRSAMVMLYSTIVCDLLLKLKELSDIYNDKKAEKILKTVNEERKKKGNSTWEWELIKLIRDRTELLSDEAYATVKHIYDLRNFSAHPAMNDDYELISPTAEMTVAYIKKAMEDIFVKPSIFADNIINRMSDDIAAKKELFRTDFDGFSRFLDNVYFCRMSQKMIVKVFGAFWKFTIVKTKEDGEIFENNRYINRKLLEVMLEKYFYELCEYIDQNKTYFRVSDDVRCKGELCVLLAYYPQIYDKLEETVQYQMKSFDEKGAYIIKWFETKDIEKHLSGLKIREDVVHPKLLSILKKVCEKQGQSALFNKFLIDHYANSCSFISTRNRFDCMIEPYLNRFNEKDFVHLIEVINSNKQIYNYIDQESRNTIIVAVANSVLSKDFDFSIYENFKFTKEVEEENPFSDDLSPLANDLDI